MKKISLSAILAIILSLNSWALNVRSSAGNLHTLIDNPAEVTELIVSGTINAEDFDFVSKNAPNITVLDLSNCEIDAIPAMTFAGSKIESLVLPANIKIGDGAFAGTQLKTLSLPENAVLGQGVFTACPELTEVAAKSAIFGGYDFASCEKLTKANVSGTSVLAAGTFADCSALHELNGLEAVSYIGDNCFRSTSSLSDFAFPAPLTYIGDNAFSRSAIASANMGKCTVLTGIGGWAFSHNDKLTDVVLPPALKYLGSGVFFNCDGIELLNMQSQLETIGSYALKGASSIKNLVLPPGVENLASGAMEAMKGLVKIDASKLKKVPGVGEDVFRGVNQAAVTLDVDKELASLFAEAYQWREFNINPVNSLTDNIVSEDNTKIEARIVGDILQLQSSGADMQSVSIYSPSGLLLLSSNLSGTQAEISIENISEHLLIVVVQLKSGLSGSIKIAR